MLPSAGADDFARVRRSFMGGMATTDARSWISPFSVLSGMVYNVCWKT